MTASAQIGGLSLEQARASLAPWPERAAAIGSDEYRQRIEQARSGLVELGVDALLVTAGASLRYFSGVPWSPTERLVALLITRRNKPVMICPAFEAGSLHAALRIDVELRLWEEHEDPCRLVADALRERGAIHLALDPAANHGVAERLRSVRAGRHAGDASGIIDACRMCKSPAETALMKQATAMTLQVHRLAARVAHEGISRSTLVRFIDEAHRALGADQGSTFCIVQFGAATAFPHGLAGEQVLSRDELVLIDTGCSVQGYQSDITRTWIFGRPTARQSHIWNLEHAAQRAAFEAVRPGVACEAADAAARTMIAQAGLGPDYQLPGLPHRTGHGCGLSIHEMPYLVRGDTTAFAPGMCCSDEPMIVVPGQFGIRLEDHFLVTPDGAEWFTPPSPAIDQPFA